MHRLSSFTLVAILLLLSLVTFQHTQAQTVFICRPGETYTLSGTTSPSTALLLLFDGQSVGGTTSALDGKYRLRLVMGNERPGDYLLQVQVRATRQIIREALCRVPAEGEDIPTPMAQAAEATPTPTATQVVSAMATNATAPQATAAGSESASAATASSTPSPSATGSSSGGSTQTPSVTASVSLTPSYSPTRTPTNRAGASTATATRTRTPTTTMRATEYELLADVDEVDPVVGEIVTVFGTLTEAGSFRGVTNVTVNVTYSFNGGSGVWCTTTIEEDDGYWECANYVTNAMADKDVVFTVQVIVNGKPLQTQVTIHAYSEET